MFVLDAVRYVNLLGVKVKHRLVVIWIPRLIIIHAWKLNVNCTILKIKMCLGWDIFCRRNCLCSSSSYCCSFARRETCQFDRFDKVRENINSYRYLFKCRLSLFQNCQERCKTSRFIGNVDYWDTSQEHSVQYRSVWSVGMWQWNPAWYCQWSWRYWRTLILEEKCSRWINNQCSKLEKD